MFGPEGEVDDPTAAEVQAQDVADLRAAVLSLAGHVSSLSDALTAVNDIQRRTANLEVAARSTENATAAIEQVLIPRDEHEARWKKEQQGLIALRLRIRKQTYLVGAVFFVASMVALGISVTTIHHQQDAENAKRKAECVTRVNSSKQAVTSYDQVLQSHTVNGDGTLKKLITAARDSAARVSLVKC